MYFQLDGTHKSKAICMTRKAEVSHWGKEAKNFYPSNLKTHLKSNHANIFSDYQQKQDFWLTKKKKADQSLAGPSMSTFAKKEYQQILEEAVTRHQW